MLYYNYIMHNSLLTVLSPNHNWSTACCSPKVDVGGDHFMQVIQAFHECVNCWEYWRCPHRPCNPRHHHRMLGKWIILPLHEPMKTYTVTIISYYFIGLLSLRYLHLAGIHKFEFSSLSSLVRLLHTLWFPQTMYKWCNKWHSYSCMTSQLLLSCEVLHNSYIQYNA